MGAALTLGACATDSDVEDDEASAEAALGARSSAGVLKFRDIFATYLKEEGRTDAEIRKLVYLPTEAMMTSPAPGANARATLDRLDRRYVGIKPSALYERGTRYSIRPLENVDAAFAEKGAVTIVMLPGIFGEFIDNAPFGDVLARTESASARAYKRHLSSASVADRTDAAYSLDNIGTTERPLSELVKVASIDGPDGKAQVTVVFPQPRTGSLETLGSLESNNQTYMRRIGKYFRTVGGAPDNLYLLGYSRGTTVALDLAVRARKERAPWAAKLKGVITLGGVVYGSQLADAAQDPSHPTGKLVARLKQLGDDLEDCRDDDSFLTSTRKVAANNHRWVVAGAELGWMASRAPTHKEIAWEGIDANLPEPGRFHQMIKRIIFQDALNLDRPVSDYCGNLRRFKTLLSEVLLGLDTLTTRSRLTWFEQNAIPSDLKLFSITGTMGDATASQGRAWPLVTNDVAYNPGSQDLKSLRANFYDLRAAGGGDLQDSQVSVQRGRFWPELLAQGNPAQGRLDTYFMGVLGTHHWGMAFSEATPTRGIQPNPFPRTTLLRSVGRFVLETR